MQAGNNSVAAVTKSIIATQIDWIGDETELVLTTTILSKQCDLGFFLSQEFKKINVIC